MARKMSKADTESPENQSDDDEDASGPPGYTGNLADIESDTDTPDDGKDYVTQAAMREEAAEIYEDCVTAFEAKKDRDDDNARFWKVYNCELTDEQAYEGRSSVFVPVVRDAIEARTLRFSNALFPNNGRFVECISSTSDNAHALQALINHYVRESRLRETITGCLRAGDVTGQYSLYVGWSKKERKITQRVSKAVQVEVEGGTQVDHPTETVDDVEQVTLSRGSPDIWVIPDEDLCVLPATVDDIDDADTICVALRVTPSWVRERKADFTKKQYKRLMALFKDKRGADPARPNPEKDRSKEAGVKADKGSKVLLMYQIWTSMEIQGEWLPCMILSTGPGADQVASIKKNPYWGQRSPVISAPVKKVAGSFWGISPTSSVERLQYQANDAINMGMDSAQYALTPIVMSDPASNPRIATMVLEMAALWEADPTKTQILSFPKLWQDALEILSAVKAQIHESLGLNPAMMPSGSTRKTSQAAVAQEQALALEGTSDAVRVLETSVLTAVANRVFEYDQQYRDKDLSIAHYGELGYEAVQEKVPPVQFGSRYSFQWSGIAQAQNAQKVQQMIAGMNVLRGIPSEQLGGRQLDIGPVLDQIVDVVYGPRLGPRVLKDVSSLLSVDPKVENSMMRQNMPATVSPLDDDAKHIELHHGAAEFLTDPTGIFAAHILQHQQSMAKKAQAAAPPGGAQGVPGGAGPGVPGTPLRQTLPRPGSQPVGPRPNAQAPAGSVRPAQMNDPGRMPQ